MHKDLKLVLLVYVDDFKMSGSKENMQAGWELIRTKIKMDDPTPIGKFLGGGHAKIDLQYKELEDQLKAAIPLPLPANERTRPEKDAQDKVNDALDKD